MSARADGSIERVILPPAEWAALRHLARARDVSVDRVLGDAICAWVDAGTPPQELPLNGAALYDQSKFSDRCCRALCWWLHTLPAGSLPYCAELEQKARDCAAAGDIEGMQDAQVLLSRKFGDAQDPERDEAGKALLEMMAGLPESTRSQIEKGMRDAGLVRDTHAPGAAKA